MHFEEDCKTIFSLCNYSKLPPTYKLLLCGKVIQNSKTNDM